MEPGMWAAASLATEPAREESWTALSYTLFSHRIYKLVFGALTPSLRILLTPVACQERGVGASEEKMAMLLRWPITKNSMACFVSCVRVYSLGSRKVSKVTDLRRS